MVENQKKENKFIKAFNTKYDFAALFVLIFISIFRYYFLFKTKAQALWFDEGTYLVQARAWALGTPAYPEPVRDWFVSFIWAGFIKLGANEIFLRFLTVTVGIATLVVFYLLVSHFFGKKIGLFSLVIASVFYETIFWSLRLDVGTYSIFFVLLSLLFFVKALENKKISYYFAATALALFAFVSHAPGILILIFYAVFIPFYSKFKFYKSKKFWLCVLLFVLILIPILIRNYTFSGGEIYPRFQSGWFDRTAKGSSLFESLIYVTSIPSILGIILFIIFLVGLINSLDIVLVLDKFDYSKKNIGKIILVIVGLISLALGIQSLMGPGGAYFEPRYILVFYFSAFAFSGIGIEFIYNFLKKYQKTLAIIVILALIIFISYSQLNNASSLITTKSQGYSEIKQAGLWLRQYSNAQDKVMSFEAPTISYYSGLKAIGFPVNDSFLEVLKKEKPKYLLLWAGIPDAAVKAQEMIKEYNLIVPIFVYPESQPAVVIYEVEESFYNNAS